MNNDSIFKKIASVVMTISMIFLLLHLLKEDKTFLIIAVVGYVTTGVLLILNKVNKKQ